MGTRGFANRAHRAGATVAGLAALGLALAGCAAGSENPRGVAEEFWSAAAAGDWEGARRLSTAPDPHRVEALLPDGELGELAFGEPLVARSSALVPTFARRGEEPTVAFNTILLRFDSGWRVDVAATRDDLRRARVTASLESVGDAARRGAGRLGEALERSAREAAEALERALEEMERELESHRDPRSR